MGIGPVIKEAVLKIGRLFLWENPNKGGEIMYWKFLIDLWESVPSYPNDETDWLLQSACVIVDGRAK